MPPENTNSVLVSSGDDCVIFDAWGRADDWTRLLESRGSVLRAIYSTHGHPDHISAAPDLAKRYGVPWYLNPADKMLVGWGNELLDLFGLRRLGADDVAPSDLLPGHYHVLPDICMNAYSAPGHTPGGLVFYFPEYKILLTGDTLFRDGVGRTDFPGGDTGMLRESISGIYKMDLPNETYVVHGHGTDSTIEILKKENRLFK